MTTSNQDKLSLEPSTSNYDPTHPSSSSENHQPSMDLEEKKQLLEVSGITLLIRHPVCPSSWSPTAQIEKWILQYINVPVTYTELTQMNDVFEILDVSVDTHKPFSWINSSHVISHHTKKKEDRPSLSSARPSTPLFHAPHRTSFSPKTSPLLPRATLAQDISSYLFMVTESTQVLLLSEKLKMSFIVDCSPSMSVVDSGGSRPKVLLSMAVETVFKILDGLVDPFTIHNQLTHESRRIEPELLVSVVADPGSKRQTNKKKNSARDPSSLFMNGNSITQDPFVKILLHGVNVHRKNLAAFQEQLYDLFIQFENTFLSLGLRNRLDPMELSSMTIPIQNEVRLELSSSEDSRPDSFQREPPTTDGAQSTETTSTTVGSAFTSIKAGCDTLDLMPQSFVGAMIYLTDGVSPGWGSRERLPRDVCARLTSHVAFFNVIQIGSSFGYKPDSSFGYVPNHEFLRFLSEAILPGTFIYAENCPYLSPNHLDRPLIPNYYHSNFMMIVRDFSPSMSLLTPDIQSLPHLQSSSAHGTSKYQQQSQAMLHTENRFGNRNTGAYQTPSPPIDVTRSRLVIPEADLTDHVTEEELIFPWSHLSKPPIVDEVLCSYRDYTMANIRLKDLISIRQKDGFRLQSVSVTPRKKKPGHYRVEIMMVLPWLNNIALDYRIKFSAAFGQSLSSSVETHSGFSCLWDVAAQAKPFRVELNVLAHYSFAILLLHVQDIDRSDQIRTSLEDKLYQLQTFLHSLTESDEVVKLLSAYNPKLFGSQTSDKNEFLIRSTSQKTLHAISDTTTPSNYWQFLNQLIQDKPHLLATWNSSLILKSTSSQTNPGLRALRALINPEDVVKARRQVATIYLSQFLSSWASVSLSKTCHVRFINNSRRESGISFRGNAPHSAGFVMLLISWETECTMRLILKFYNLSVRRQMEVIDDVTSSLKAIEHNPRSTQKSMKPIIVCDGTLHPFLVRYEPLDHVLSPVPTRAILPDQINTQPSHSRLRSSSFGIPKLEQFVTLKNHEIEGYFCHHRWVWFPFFEQAERYSYSFLDQVQQKAFVALYNRRLDDGFLPVSELPGCITFYKEVVREENGKRHQYSIQYALLFRPSEKMLVSELWIHPLFYCNLTKNSAVPDVTAGPLSDIVIDIGSYEVTEFDANDRYLLNQLLAYQILRSPHETRDRLIQDMVQQARVPYEDPLNNTYVVPFAFYLATTLRNVSFRVYAYKRAESSKTLSPNLLHSPYLQDLLPMHIPKYAFGWFEGYKTVGDDVNTINSDTTTAWCHGSCALPKHLITRLKTTSQLTNAIFSGFVHASLHEKSGSAKDFSKLAPLPYFFLEDNLFQLIDTHINHSEPYLSEILRLGSLSTAHAYLFINPVSIERGKMKLIVLDTYSDRVETNDLDTLQNWPFCIFDLDESDISIPISNTTGISLSDSFTQERSLKFNPIPTGRLTSSAIYRLGTALRDSESDTEPVETDGWILALLEESFNCAFARAVHSSLLFGIPCWAHDLEKMFNIMKVKQIDFDLTDFLLVLTQLNIAGHPILKEGEELRLGPVLKQSFQSIAPLMMGDTEDQQLEAMYFFNPHPTGTLDVDADGNLTRSASVELVHTAIECATAPFLLLMTCTFDLHKDGPHESLVKHVHDLPFCFPTELLEFIDSTISAETGLESLLNKNSRQVSARFTLNCISLDEEEDDTNSVSVGPASRRTGVAKDQALNNLAATIRRIIQDKLLNGILLLARSSTEFFSILPNIIQIADSDPGYIYRVDYLGQELDSSLLTPVKIRLVTPFVLPPDGYDLVRQRLASFFCDGLSIKSVPEHNDIFVVHDQNWFDFNHDDTTVDTDTSPRFFLSFQLRTDLQECNIDFFARSLDIPARHILLAEAQRALTLCFETVSRRLLLQELLQTHVARSILIPAAIGSLEATISPSTLDDPAVIASFDPQQTLGSETEDGRLACSCLYEESFHVHWRVPIGLALDSVTSSLQPMAITNRPNMFVLSSNSLTHYLRIMPSDTIHVNSTTDIPQEQRYDAGKPPSAKPKRAPLMVKASSIPNQTEKKTDSNQALVVQIYGVDSPSDQVIKDLVKLIQNKINLASVNVMSSFLARNSSHRLTFSDLDFLCPIRRNVGPNIARLFVLPKAIKSIHLFLLLLRQTLISCWQALIGNDARECLRAFYSKMFSYQIDTEPTSQTVNEFHLGDLSFICNQFPSRTCFIQTSECAKKTGIATICLTPIGYDGSILFPAGLSSLDQEEVRHLLSEDEIDMTFNFQDIELSEWGSDASKRLEANGHYGILLTAWTVGTISCFLEEFRICLSDTIQDYILEAHIRKSFYYPLPDHEVHADALQKTLQGFESSVLSADQSRGSPIVHHLSVDIALPIHVLAYSLSEVLHHLGLRPMAFRKLAEQDYIKVDQLEEANYQNAWNDDADSDTTSYMICGMPRAARSHSNPNSRRSSVVSDESSSVNSANRAASTSSLFRSHKRHGSDASDLSSILETILIFSTSRRGSRAGVGGTSASYSTAEQTPDLLITGAVDTFTPIFPIFGGRSCTVIIHFTRKSFRMMMYNWKKQTADVVFLKCVKVLTWCQIHRQFQERRASFTGVDLQKTLKSADQYEKRYSSANDTPSEMRSSQMSMSRPLTLKQQDPHYLYRVLDFISHLGSFDAIHLQKQIVDSLELFFQHGKLSSRFPVISSQQSHARPKTRSISISSPKFMHEFTVSSPITPLGPDGSLTLNEMSSILHTIRLVHSASSPIFFSTHRGDLLLKWQKLLDNTELDEQKMLFIASNKRWSSLVASPLSTNIVEIESWFRAVLSRYMTEYVRYLEALGLEILPWDQRAWIPGNVLPADIRHPGLFHVNPNIQIETPSVSLRKVLPSGTILVHCGFYEYFSTINVLAFTSTDESGDLTELQKSCDFFKKYTHIVSFSYDFHLRFIAESLRQASTSYPMNVLDVLKAFKVLYSQKARFARNRLVHGKIPFDTTLSLCLYRYVLDSPQKYGMQPVSFNGKVIGCSFTASRPDFRETQNSNITNQIPRASNESSFSYTVVIYVANDDNSSSSKLNLDDANASFLEYYLLLVDEQSSFPHAELDETTIMTHDLLRDPMKEYICEGYYLHDITTNAERCIAQLLEKAGKHFGRDSIWQQLVDATFSAESTSSPSSSLDWTGIFLDKFGPNSRTLQSIDPKLECLFSNSQLPWSEILSLLERFYPETLRVLPLTYNSGVAAKHYVLLNQKNSDYALHIGIVFAFSGVSGCLENNSDEILNPFVLDIEASAVSREGFPDCIEYDQISEVVNTILYLLWEK